MRITRKQASKDEILRLLKQEPAGLSNRGLAEKMGLPYAAVRQATFELDDENKIRGQVGGNERYGFALWKLA